ncbi:MAG: 2-phospho-L-lactate transferase [Actinomycetota bacterium]
MKVAALAGGVGGAKLLVGLQRALPAGNLTALVNTGDDALIYGVHVSPDVDIVTYRLAGIGDTERGWGVRGDTFEVLEALRRLGAESWFALGDRDLATCIYRTERLRDGATLSIVTDEIRRALGTPTLVLPMSDDPVRTVVACADGRTLGFQEYFVRERTAPEVAAVSFAGIEDAKPAPGIIESVERADRVIVCPSNPILSIAPMLALPGVRAALQEHPSVVAVTPLVRGAAVKGPADRLMRDLGMGSSASAVARLYADFVDAFVVDGRDPDQVGATAALGLRAEARDTMMPDENASERLGRALLEL